MAALQDGDALLASLIPVGQGSDLNVEYNAEEEVDADASLVGRVVVNYDAVQRVVPPEGETRHTKRRRYPFRIVTDFRTDNGINDPGGNLHQALDRIFGDSRVFFAEYVNDVEANLAALAGRVELDEEMIEVVSRGKTRVTANLTIALTQKHPTGEAAP